MSISIAMATYNGQKYLREQLETLAAQTQLPLELVVTDDGSSDGTLDILGNFALTAAFPVRIHQNVQRLGYQENFFRCADLCTGQYIAFCDQDDLWHPEKLARIAAAFKKETGAVLVVHRGLVVDTDNAATGAYYPALNSLRITRRGTSPLWMNVPGFAMTFDARLIRKVQHERRLSDPITGKDLMAHDQWIYLLAGAVGHIVFLPDDLVRYRRHDSNTTPVAPVRPYRRLIHGFRQSLTTGHRHYQQMNVTMKEYERFFNDLALGSPDFQSEFKEASSHFGKLSQQLLLRAGLYMPGSNLLKRADSLVRLISEGCYAESHFGRRALAKDALVAVLGTFRESTSC